MFQITRMFIIIVIREGGEHMTTTANKIKVKKEIYLWAIKESQKEIEEVKNKFNKIEDWISQSYCPTFRQLENLANFLKIPLGYMFLDKPPKTNIVKSEFRTIGNKVPSISKDLYDTLYNMGRKKDWLSDYRRNKGWNKLIPDEYKDLNKKDFNVISQLARDYLGLNEFWYKEYKDTRLAFNYLREKFEAKGIIVMQNGIVGTNTHRNLNVSEFRGFLLYDDIAPLIFINSKDSPNGKIFTLIHEYIHFLLQEDDIFIDEYQVHKNKNEKKINRITAEFLVPASHINELWNKDKDEIKQIGVFSRLFHVSKIAVAIKLNDMSIVTQNTVDIIKQKNEVDWEGRDTESNGGNFYKTSKSRYSNSFVKSVIQGAESGEISYTYAFNLFDGSAKTYDYFKEEIMGYGE